MFAKYSTTTQPYSIKIGNLCFGSETVGGYGPTTQNLLYDNGVINWDIGPLGSTINTSTIISNSRYRITCSAGGAFRFYMSLSKLVNGLTYTLSLKYTIISGSTFNMTDWNDTVTNINTIDYGSYKFLYGTGTRSTYDGTYRFMDFSISTGGIVDIWDVQLEQRSFYTPFTNGVSGFWNGIDPPTSGYTIYYATATRPEPSIICTGNDTQLIYWANALGGSNITTTEGALLYFRGNSNTAVFNMNLPSIVTSGLTLYLDAGMVASYPKTGTTWYDLNNNTNNITGTDIVYTSGINSLYFNGTSSNAHPTITHSYLSSSTLEIVFNSSFHTGYTTIFGYSHNNGYSSPTIGSIYLSGNNLMASVICASQTYRQISISDAIQTGVTYHVVLNKNTISGNLELFINGVSRGTQTFDAATYGQWNTAGTYIGSNILDIGKSTNSSAGQGWSTDYFKGYMHSLRLYNRVLTSTEVLQNYYAEIQKMATFNIITSNLVNYFDAGSSYSYPKTGSTWCDIVGGVIGTFDVSPRTPTFDSSNSGSIYFDGNALIKLNLVANVYNPILLPNAFTAYFWIKTGSNGGIFGDSTGGPANASMFISSGKLAYNHYDSQWSTYYSTGATVTTNTWTQVVYARTTSTIKIYVNGVFDYSASARTTFTGGNMTGFGNLYFLNSITGYISMFALYSIEHTQLQILQNFNATKSRYNFPTTASQLLDQNPSITNGVYWLNPSNSPTPIQAYCDFTTANGPWVHVGTAVGNTRGLYTYKSTWASRTTDSGDIKDPYNTTTSSFNAESFMYCKGDKIMIKYGLSSYTQASGFTNESWRDVYSFLNSVVAWPTQPSYNRQLTITSRSGITSSITQGSGLLYGSRWTIDTNLDYYYVYCFDNGGDTYAYLTTGSYGVPTSGQTAQIEADHGIGANENGPNASVFPGDDYALTAGVAYDAGTNDPTDSGATSVYNNIPFSLWIKN